MEFKLLPVSYSLKPRAGPRSHASVSCFFLLGWPHWSPHGHVADALGVLCETLEEENLFWINILSVTTTGWSEPQRWSGKWISHGSRKSVKSRWKPGTQREVLAGRRRVCEPKRRREQAQCGDFCVCSWNWLETVSVLLLKTGWLGTLSVSACLA